MTQTASPTQPPPAGSDARPRHISLKGWVALTRRVVGKIGSDRISLVAAGCAFFGLLAIFPGLVAVMAIAGFFIDAETVAGQVQNLASVMPQEAAQIVISQAQGVAGSDSGGLGLAAIVGLMITFYSSTAAVRSVIQGLNVAFDVPEERSFLRLYATQFALTLGVIVGFILIAAVLVVLPIVLSFLQFGEMTAMVATLLRWPFLLLVIVSGLSVLYRYGPSRRVRRWRWITPGAGIACLLWIAGSVAFSYYVSNFGSYNETFGALGGVVVLLMWLWLSAFIMLLGAEFDAEIEAQAKLDPQPPTMAADRISANALDPGKAER